MIDIRRGRPGGDDDAERGARGGRFERERLPRLIGSMAEPIVSIEAPDLRPLLERIGDARVVCIGEATHGTSEFYALRARITRALIERGGFTIVAAEADWPDAAGIDRFVRGEESGGQPLDEPFSRFPTWMWANEEVLEFIHWLRERNQYQGDPERMAGFYGLDVYSLSDSIHAVLSYLDQADPEAAREARSRYSCFGAWQENPAAYGMMALRSGHRCEDDVVAQLEQLLERRLELAAAEGDGARFFDAAQNARVVANAERYYRVMYQGSRASWNLRDTHMFETLLRLLDHRAPNARAVVWAHNSHLGDASATEMGSRGELNLGQLCRERFGDEAYLIGLGTDHGTVAAASEWDGPMEVKRVRPSRPDSYESLCHEAGIPAFCLPLRNPRRPELREELIPQRLERAIGVIYRPETELQSHYFHASLPQQFDEWIWIDETRAVSPLPHHVRHGMPETFPFGL